MNDATLLVLFIANACAIVGLVVLAVRGFSHKDYSRYIPPLVIDLRDDVEPHDEVHVPAQRAALDDLRMRRPHTVSPD
ncbi:MAG: hypothetical protein ACLGIG_02145 [Actinomycetes bacterium]